MSFEAVWGFDPEEVLKTRKAIHAAKRQQASEEESAPEQEIEGLRIPSGLSAQLDALRRMFRS